jgi:uncharacterized protein (TIGR03435 family)
VRFAFFLLAFSATTLVAQSPATSRFDVASVKIAPNQYRGGPRPLAQITAAGISVLPGGRVESYGQTLRNLIAWVYDVDTVFQRIEGGDQQILETEFAISAKAATPSVSRADAKMLMRALLEERFRLRWRLQLREVDGFVLVPSRDDARPGPGLRPFNGDCEARADNPPVRFENPDYEEKARCGWNGMLGRQRGVGVSMTQVADRLTGLMATPVSDDTRWPGLFTFDLTAGTDAMPLMAIIFRPAIGVGAPLPTGDAPQLLEVLRTELGLKLVKKRTATTDFIIEHMEPLIED